MPTNFPTALDVIPNPSAEEALASPTPALKHATQHDTANDAIEALEAKVGIDSSEDTGSLDYRLSAVEAALPVAGDAWDDEFDGAAFDTTKWTWVNQSSTTIAQNSGCAVMSMPNEKFSLLVQPITGTNWRVEAKVWAMGENTRWPYFGIAAYETASNQFCDVILAWRTHLSRWTMMAHGMRNPFNPSTIAFDALGSEVNFTLSDSTIKWAGPLYVAIDRNGSSLTFYVSNNPAAWVLLGSYTIPGAVFTVAPDKVGLVVGGANTPSTGIFEYIRKVR